MISEATINKISKEAKIRKEEKKREIPSQRYNVE